MFSPVFTITPAIATALMAIEADRQFIMELPITVELLAGLRHSAQLAATHYSTQIEGNRLTRAQVEHVLAGAHFPGRERDEAEVRDYYKALEFVEALAPEGGLIGEDAVRRIHSLVMTGKAALEPYREGQNVIRDGTSGAIVYLPPEAADVAALMRELFTWVNEHLESWELPIPIVAAVTHYQYATLHPYYDGNGRTARLLATLVLHRAGYGLKGIYSLDQHYACDLASYYKALTVGPSHNYYLGRAEADITEFVSFFCQSMADALGTVRAKATEAAASGATDDSAILRRLEPRKRLLLELFHRTPTATTVQMATHLGLSPRTVGSLVPRWTEEGFLELADASRRSRSYRLTPPYERLAIRD
ncbi:MAG: Fic family protein [Trebonia sp.]